MHELRHTDGALVHCLNRTPHRSTKHQVSTDLFFTRCIEGRVAVRFERVAALHKELDDGNEACVLQHESRHDVPESTQLE